MRHPSVNMLGDNKAGKNKKKIDAEVSKGKPWYIEMVEDDERDCYPSDALDVGSICLACHAG